LTDTERHAWEIRSIVVSVRDLDISSAFYQDVMNAREVLREDQVAVISDDSPPTSTVYLRQAQRNALHGGQQTLGARVICWDVRSPTELDRVDGRLRALNAFRDRRILDKQHRFEMVHGQDPDRLPLLFVAHTGELPVDEYRKALANLYAVDL
jgi:catechol 2,3-dioxygenase-like lactoylglutathione lyase family enzyme